MAQNITLLGANYPDVPAVTLPITGGGTATFSDTRSVTYNLSGGATASVTPSEVVAGQGFSVKLTAPTGYVLSGVTVTMGGNDITSQVFTPDAEGGGGGTSRTVIAPEQTVTVEGYFTAITSTEGLVDGDAYVYTIDGTEIVGTAIPNGTMLYLNSGTTYAIGDNNGYLYLVTQETGQHTIKVEKLDLDGGGGGGGANLQTKSVSYTPTTSAQSAQVTADSGYDGLEQVNVSVGAIPSEYIIPSGTKSITENGTGIDVTQYASVDVAVSGASPVKTATGTFTGNGTRQVTISCDFEPDLIYWTSDPGTSASSGTVAGIIAREMMAASRYRNNSTTNSHYAVIDITAMNTGGSSYSFRATYADNTITLYGFSNNARALFTSGRTYSYKLVKWTT